jgi:hypothetical protein
MEAKVVNSVADRIRIRIRIQELDFFQRLEVSSGAYSSFMKV